MFTTGGDNKHQMFGSTAASSIAADHLNPQLADVCACDTAS
jgi:hypothetical protein